MMIQKKQTDFRRFQSDLRFFHQRIRNHYLLQVMTFLVKQTNAK